MSWLNAEAELNIYLISVTFSVFHFEISPLNVLFRTKALKSTSTKSAHIRRPRLTYPNLGMVPYQTSCRSSPADTVVHSHSSRRSFRQTTRNRDEKSCQLASGIGEGPTVHELAGPVTAWSHVYFARNAVAPENIKLCAVVAAVPVHEEMSWLNAEAESNIPSYQSLALCSNSQCLG